MHKNKSANCLNSTMKDPENKIFAVYMKNSHFDGGSGAKTSAEFENDVYASFEK